MGGGKRFKMMGERAISAKRRTGELATYAAAAMGAAPADSRRRTLPHRRKIISAAYRPSAWPGRRRPRCRRRAHFVQRRAIYFGMGSSFPRRKTLIYFSPGHGQQEQAMPASATNKIFAAAMSTAAKATMTAFSAFSPMAGRLQARRRRESARALLRYCGALYCHVTAMRGS